jgi:hypothetical protein
VQQQPQQPQQPQYQVINPQVRPTFVQQLPEQPPQVQIAGLPPGGLPPGSFIQYAPQPVIYPVSHPQQKLPPQQLPGQPPAGSFMMVGPQGQLMSLPPGALPPGAIILPNGGNRGMGAVVQPKPNMIPVSFPPQNSPQQPVRAVIVQNPQQQQLQQTYFQHYQVGQQPFGNEQIVMQQQHQQQHQQHQQHQQYQQHQQHQQGNHADLQKKRQMEEDEALARRLQEEENRNAF